VNRPDLQQLIRQGAQAQRQGELRRAKAIYRQVLQHAPHHPDALHLYGLACHQQGDHATAIDYIRKAIERAPGQPVLHNNLGDALCKAGRFDEAAGELHKAIELKPDYAGAHQNLATAYARSGKPDVALDHARKAVRLDDSRPEAWFDLGLVLLDHLLLDDAVAAFRRALALRPAYPRAATSLLYTLTLLPGPDPAAVAAEHLDVAGKAFPAPQANVKAKPAGSRIRIGYVSGDFRSHAVNYFFEPVLDAHDRSRFEIFCYSDTAHPDAVSARLAGKADHWFETRAWGDGEFVENVRQDGVDVLVDLAGHTRDNRLGVFARQAAPRQVSWLGYPNTTGLAAMNYRVADAVTEPRGEAAPGSEQLLRLPGAFACFRPPEEAPAVTPAPFASSGLVTLGCLHKLEKLNDAVVGLWAEILLQNPGCRVLFARDQFSDWQQRRLRDRFEQRGVGAERLEMVRIENPEEEFFDCFGAVDLLLDTFPWSGHTLACCALHQGVPVVTLRGNSHAGRMVASVLEGAGIGELIAADTADYAAIVARLCAEPGRVVEYRAALRDRFGASPARDERGFTLELEAAYLRICKH
jgi:predicted O-linked N-acetylglucosamine transferase (SPINDLY family)